MITVPCNVSNVNHWSFVGPLSSTAPPGFVSYRQAWQTRVPACGSWFFNQRCSDRFFDKRPAPHTQGLVYGAVPEVRLHVFFQEDGSRNGGDANAAGGRKLLVQDVVAPVKVYQLNGEHGGYGAYSEFKRCGSVLIAGCKSEQAYDGPVYWARNVSTFISMGHGGLAAPPTVTEPYPSPFPNYLTALYRVEGDGNYRIVNLTPQKWDSKSNWSPLLDLGHEASEVYRVSAGLFPVVYVRN
jgi:hypothetical protein